MSHHRGTVRHFIVGIAVLGSLASGVGGASSLTVDAPTAKQVVVKLRASGLPIGKFKVYTESSDGNHLLGRPGQYAGKVNFRDRRIRDGGGGFAVSSGGSVEVFPSKVDAKRRLDFIASVTSVPGTFAEYDYLAGDILLRLSPVLTPAQAEKYATTLRRLM